LRFTPDKFYKRKYQEKRFGCDRIFSDIPARLNERGYFLPSAPWTRFGAQPVTAVWVFSPHGFHRGVATKPVCSETDKQNGWASKRTPFFRTIEVIAAILRASVRRAISGLIPLAARAAQNSWKGPALVAARMAAKNWVQLKREECRLFTGKRHQMGHFDFWGSRLLKQILSACSFYRRALELLTVSEDEKEEIYSLQMKPKRDPARAPFPSRLRQLMPLPSTLDWIPF
jgi:hypothetical protein